MVAVRYGRFSRWTVALAAVCTAGCGVSPANHAATRPDIQSPDVAGRIRAIQAATLQADPSVLPHLVDRLEDEDSAVRFAAFYALRRLTGKTLGYNYGAAVEQRTAAVARWRRALAADAAAPPPRDASSNR